MASTPPESREETVRSALLDYYEAPGKHRLQLRQPAILFSSVPVVLQLAARSATGGRREAQVREAASFFIRAAMLYPGANHYALFGLESRKEPVDLKERYRLVMRLIHPDFAVAGEWPSDAAIRVNRAYDVLSSPMQRRAYDEQLAAQRGASGRAEDAGARDARRARTHRFATAAVVAAAALGALLILAPSPRPVSLVQKRPATPSPAPAPASTFPQAHAPAPALTLVEPMAPQAAPALLVPGDRAEPPAVLAAAAVMPPAPRPVHALAQPARAVAVAPPEALQLRIAPAEFPPAVAAIPTAAAAPPLATGTEERASPAAAPARPPATLAAARPVAAPPPTLSEVQPLLSHMLETLESGSGERLLALLDPSARKLPAAVALSNQYEDLVRGAAPVRLANGEFRGEARNGVLHVTGTMRVHAGEPTIASDGQRFVVRAEFAVRDGKLQLTGLSGAGD